jgi:hypothetical protein
MFEGAGQGSCLVPKVTCLLLPIPGHRLPIGGASTITESLPSGQEKDPQNQEKVHCHKVWVVLYLAKRAAYIVVAKIQFVSGVRYPQVPHPGKVVDPCLGENDFGLGGFGRVVVDGHRPRLRTELLS